MKLSALVTIVLVSSVHTGVRAQPRYSPEVRAKRETAWMKDSLGITPGQASQAEEINTVFNREMDKTGQITNTAEKAKKQALLRRKKNVQMRTLLNAAAYQKYLSWERQQAVLDKQRAQNSKGPHRPQ